MNISPQKDRKAIRLQFTVEGVRFSFSPLRGGKWENKHDRQLVAAIATKIENDIRSGHFDPSLERYRHKVEIAQSPLRAKCNDISWLEVWDDWVSSINLGPQTKADHYQCVRRSIEKANNPQLSQVEWLENLDLAASTFNRRLSMLRSAVAHNIRSGKISTDPLAKISARKTPLEEEEAAEAKKQPLNNDEISRIIKYFEEHHPTYAPFVEFLLYTGVRTSEAVGIRWKDIDLSRRLISISQAITRERGKYAKVRKRPKTLQSARTLKMSDRIYSIIVKNIPDKIDSDALIFLSPKGCIIDHGNFRRIWKNALEELKLPYRKPYATRHTLLSQALEAGLTIPQVAGIAGHKDGRMIVQHYGRIINQPQLPE
jgi:integrase